VNSAGSASRLVALTAGEEGAIEGAGEAERDCGVMYCNDWTVSRGGSTPSDCHVCPVAASQRIRGLRIASDKDGEDRGRVTLPERALRSKGGDLPV
jgi:hypothetical protein